jgi:hypothetical protein
MSDVLPAHLNRDSFRDSFKGLVLLEIIIDLPIGFPINNIISLCQTDPVLHKYVVEKNLQHSYVPQHEIDINMSIDLQPLYVL